MRQQRRGARDPGWAPLRRHRPGRRRLASAGLTAAALAVGLQVLAPQPPAGEAVLVASADVAAGSVLTAADLRTARWRPDQLPDGALTDPAGAVGRAVSSGVRAGEALTDARLVGPGLLSGTPDDQVAVPVRIADAQASALARPGDHVDVLVATAESRSAREVVSAATVLARPVPQTSDGGLVPAGDDASSGGLLVLAVDAAEAADLAQASAQGPLFVVFRAA